MLGNGRCEIHCFDGQKRLGHIRGKMRKKVWVNAGDIVLVGLRDFQDDKCDIILKYSADESRALQRKGELPDNIVLNEATDTGDGAEVEFEVDFDEEEEVAKQPARGAMPELDIDDI
jgi:translation initiation factor 1A